MARNGSGTYELPAGQPVVAGTAISSATFNTLTNDLANALTTSLASDGQTTPTANLTMGGFKHINVASGTARNHYAALAQVQDSAATWLTGVSGTNTIVASLAVPTLAAYATGQAFRFVSAGANTGAVTLNINSLGAKSVTKNGSTALTSGEIASGQVCHVVYDGTRFQLLNKNLASPGAIGGTTAAAGTFTSLTATSVLVNGGGDIKGDFTSGAVGTRTSVTSSTTNGITVLPIVPNGTATTAGVECVSDTGSNPSSLKTYVTDGSAAFIESGRLGTGAYLPLQFLVGGSERFRVATSGQLGIGGANYGSAGQALISGGSSAAPVWDSSLIESGAKTATGTAVLFSSIPSWVNRLELVMRDVSTNGTNSVQIRLGTSSGIVVTGYDSVCTITTSTGGVTNDDAGFVLWLSGYDDAIQNRTGRLVLQRVTGNVWVASGTFMTKTSTNTQRGTVALAGSISLASALTQLQITMDGTDTFDSGTFNLFWQ